MKDARLMNEGEMSHVREGHAWAKGSADDLTARRWAD